MRTTYRTHDNAFVLTKPDAGDGLNEQGVAPNGGGPPNGMGGQGLVQEVVEEPHPDNIQVDAYTQLRVTVQGLKETVGE